MATNFYKQGGSYYRADTGQKILNLDQLKVLAKAGGKEISPPMIQTQIPTITPVDQARQRLETLEKEQLARAGQQYLIEPTYASTYKQIESPELQKRIATTASQMYSAPAEARTRYAGQVYNPADIERLSAAESSRFEQLLSSLQDIKEKREAKAATAGKYALAQYQAGTERLGVQKDITKSAYERLLAEEEQEYKRGRETEADKLAREKFALELKKEGYPIPSSELGISPDVIIDNRTSGSVSWRHNNPLNIKYGDFVKKYGATQGQKATDGGSFAVFPDIETGLQAAKDLLKSPSYQNLTLEQAMKKWSGGGYGAEIYKGGISLPINRLSDIQLDELIKIMQQREGWKEGTVITPEQKIDFTDQEQRKLEQKFGITWKQNTSRQQQLDYLYGDDQIEKALKSIDNFLVSTGIPREVAKGILLDQQEGQSVSEIEKSLVDAGWPKEYYKQIIDALAKSPLMGFTSGYPSL